LRSSAQRFVALLEDTPDEWLGRRIEMIDTPGSLSGWRLLMMMLEHEVHHRSQIDTYAGLQGCPCQTSSGALPRASPSYNPPSAPDTATDRSGDAGPYRKSRFSYCSGCPLAATWKPRAFAG
jgi:hypothetical protein